jgi:hypothetical protein
VAGISGKLLMLATAGNGRFTAGKLVFRPGTNRCIKNIARH